MIYLLGIFISLTAGFLVIRLLAGQRLNLILHTLLALALGFAIDGVAAFLTHILCNQSSRWLPIGLVLLGIISLQVKLKILFKEITASLKNVSPPDAQKYIMGLLTLGVLAIPLVISAYYFPLGGWDAWSCWNLKAKFIFLGQQNWKDMLEPGLWRSNTHYPLLWPLVNVWFWDLKGNFDQAVPMLNSIVIALLTAGILLFGLLELTGMLMVSVLAAVIVTALPFGVILYTSQYSDSLLGLFLLSTFMCWLLSEKYKLPKLKILGILFLGLMSFTKNEGLVIAAIAAVALFWHERSHKKELKLLCIAFFLALLPTLIFTVAFAPKNEAFINGLVSTEKPTTWSRLGIILAYPCFELISAKWHAFWILGVAGMLVAGKRLWRSTLGVIGVSVVLYMSVVMAYYAVNTYFEIGWWLGQTLSRILFALVPTIALWIGVGLLD